MICSRAWRALMIRNGIYIKRSPIGTLLSILLPVAFYYLILLIKNLVGDDINTFIEAELTKEAFIPLSFTDYVTAMLAERKCVEDDVDFLDYDYSISGMPYNGYNWMVPFVKCDPRSCDEEDEDAQPYCEYMALALAGDDEGGKARAEKFKEWIYEQYPIFDPTVESQEVLPFDFEFIQMFDSSAEMDSYVKSNAYDFDVDSPKIGMGIVFEGNDSNSFKYSLRQNSTNYNNPTNEIYVQPGAPSTPDTKLLFANFAREDNVCFPVGGHVQGPPVLADSCTGNYMYNGILTIQRLVHDFIMQDSDLGDGVSAKNKGFYVSQSGVQFAAFPTRAYEAGGFFEESEAYFGLLIVLGFLFPVANMILYITREKNLRQKELMKMMSVNESDIGWSWFSTFMSLNALSGTFCAMVSWNLYENSNKLSLWIFWMFAWAAITTFSMALSTITSKPSRAVLIGVMVFFCGSIIGPFVDYKNDSIDNVFLASFHPMVALTYGLYEVGLLEDSGVGLTSNTADTTDHPSGFTYATAVGYLFWDALFWGAVYWYFNRVIKPDYGQALPWYFPFMSSYWMPSRAAPPATDNYNVADSDDIPLEPVGDALKKQKEEGTNIEISGLRKEFGDKVAVDGLSLSMYSGQITALLGHNGAGKTTTINMLTGAMSPTGGTAIVAGKDIRTQMHGIREDIGVCLQHDCLFPMLTVREHLQFFARLKGLYAQVSAAEAEQQIDQAIADVALSEKRNTFSKNLSGGMKRKLSVAIAFCGGSKVVLLDEPTSGMDPFSRRFTWNVIRQYRPNRCVILTTHFMDEADILGDRIAIMAEGRLRCAGSSLFLKKTYGVGYQLTIERQHGTHDPVSTSSHGKDGSTSSHKKEGVGSSRLEIAEELTASTNDGSLQGIVTEAVPEASLLSDVGTELSYQLPIGASEKFFGMFQGLDAEVDKGNVSSYGLSITTLEEVFLLVARGNAAGDEEKQQYRSSRRLATSNDNDTSDDEKSARSKMNLETENMFFRHLEALFYKRAANFRRDKKAWCCTSVAPSVLVLLGFIAYVSIDSFSDFAPVVLDFNIYNPDVKDTPRNPIAYNGDGTNSVCQPGRCAYGDTNDTSYDNEFCGSQSWLESEQSCSISVADGVAQHFTNAGAEGIRNDTYDLYDILTESEVVLGLSDSFAASQYGAVFFTHDNNSVVEGDVSYASLVAEECKNKTGDLSYTSENECELFGGGIGYVIHYNVTSIHAGPMFQVLADEAIIREAHGDPDFEISCTIDPLPITGVEESRSEADDAFLAWFLLVLSFPFICGAFATFVVEERESKSKHLQTVGGVSPSAYWCSTYLWDVMNYQIPLWVTVLLIFALDISVLKTTEKDAFSAIIAILFLFGSASAGFTYCLSFAFKNPAFANMCMIISGFLIGMGGPMTVWILDSLGQAYDNQKFTDIANIIQWICQFHPAFNLGKGILFVIYVDAIEYFEGEEYTTVWNEDIVLNEVIFLAWESVVYLVLAIFIDILYSNPRVMQLWRLVTFQWVCSSGGGGVDITSALPDDDDVLAEQERVLAGEANDDLIVVNQMTKVYDNGKKAVNNMSLGIHPGECFGLLGINGAGKTTTMSMLTAEFPPSSGDATLAGFSVVNEPEKTRRRIGYCPQFDAHFPNLTGREHVELYASIKGIPREHVKEAASAKLSEVGLSEDDSNRVTSGYSGGMRRRLSLACATIGQPQIVFLDECSTGVDPVARREIWQLVSDLVSAGDNPAERTSVVLTTHSMEECEALCPRIGIMANGRLRCLGSAQHLKSKFGKGYQVEMKIKVVDEDDVDFQGHSAILRSSKPSGSSDPEAPADDVVFNLEEASAALRSLPNGDHLALMVTPENDVGYAVWKDASSASGISLKELGSFAAAQIRMTNLASALTQKFPNSILRERQDTKVRYEISSESVRISDIFAMIEEKKESLHLSDYGVSQTSLEQVFNMHAAEAEKLKQGRDDN